MRIATLYCLLVLWGLVMRADFKRHKNYPVLSEFQIDVIEGTLLGDSHLELHKNGRHASYKFEQSIRHVDYVNYICEYLRPFSSEAKSWFVDKSKWGKGVYELCGFRTCCHPQFTKIHGRWYSDQIKVVPQDLELNWRKVSYWFADDGHRKESSKKELVLCTESFTETENQMLSEILLRDLCVKTTLIKNGNNSEGEIGYRLSLIHI